MAAPATSARQNAFSNVVSTLQGVTKGAAYNFTIDAVGQGDGPFFIWLDDASNELGVKTAAFVEEGLGSWVLETQDGLWVETVEVFVQVATLHTPDHPNPFLQTSDSRALVRSKLVADVLKALMADHTRGGYAKRGTVLTDDAPIQLDQVDNGEWVPSPWVAHELRFEMMIEVDENTP